jgi:TM2 domain-containing membrane protein YozV
MLENLLTILTRLILGVVAIGLAIGLFFIGIIALWYFLLIGTAVWLFRRLFLFWKGRQPEIITAESTDYRSKSSHSGRIIDHDG